MKRAIITICFASLTTLTGCSQKSDQSAGFVKTSFDPSAATKVTLDGKPVSVAGITFVPPTTWTDLGPSSMRVTTFSFGPIEGEKDSATLAVSFFGQNSGGGIDDNIKRWVSQMKPADGVDSHESVVHETITVDSMTARIVELAGTFMSGGMMGSPAVPKENYRMTGVVLETPGGNVFFKLTGPVKTAQKMAGEFAAVLLKVKKSEAAM
jgi:hypothetical protein